MVTAVGLFTLNLPAVQTSLGLEPLFRIGEPFLYFSVWAFLVTMGVLVIVSFCTTPLPREQIEPLIYRRRNRQTS